MRLVQYPNAQRHPLGEHGILLALPLSLVAWAMIITVVF